MTTTCPVCELHAESIFKIEGMDCHEEVAILEHRLETAVRARSARRRRRRPAAAIKYDAAKLSTVANRRSRRADRHARLARARGAGGRRRVDGGGSLVVGVRRALRGSVSLAAVRRRARPRPGSRSQLSVALGGVHDGAARARQSFARGHLDINVLMLVAVAGAMALGEWAEAASVVFLFALAQLLEARAMERARGAIRALMDLAPAEALVRRDGTGRNACRSTTSASATSSSSGRARRSRSTAASLRARATSTRRRSPANRCRSTRTPATRCSPARSTAAARSTSTVTRLRARLDAGAHHPPGRAGAGAARAEPDVRRSLRAHLHAGRPGAGRARRAWCRRCARRPMLERRGSIARSCCWSSRARARW